MDTLSECKVWQNVLKKVGWYYPLLVLKKFTSECHFPNDPTPLWNATIEWVYIQWFKQFRILSSSGSFILDIKIKLTKHSSFFVIVIFCEIKVVFIVKTMEINRDSLFWFSLYSSAIYKYQNVTHTSCPESCQSVDLHLNGSDFLICLNEKTVVLSLSECLFFVILLSTLK